MQNKMKGKIFNAQEVQSILNGSKVMFREVIKPQPKDQQKHLSKTTFSQKKEEIGKVFLTNHNFADFLSRKDSEEKIECPYQVGQEIFVKETFCVVDDTEHGEGIWIDYRATPKYEASHPAGWDNEPDSPDALKWKSPVHMKQEHSRLTLRIKSVKVERLVDIDINGLEKEGLPEKYDAPCPASWFAKLWNSTRKKPEEKWEANPFVFCFSYEVVKIN